MSVKIGDTVRYLNAVGGGVVTSFQSKDVILVEEEDGFETPVLIRDVVVVKPTNEYNFPIEEVKVSKKTVEENLPEPQQNIIEDQYTWSEREETPEGEKLNLYLAFVPKDIKVLQTTEMELFLVNDSNYFIQFSLNTGQETLNVVEQGQIEPQTKLYVCDVSKTELNDYEYIRLQAFAYKRIAFNVKPVIDFSIRINPVKFYKLHTFKENDFFDSNAMMLTIVENDVMNFEILIDPNELQKAINSKDLTKTTKPQKHNKRPDIIEVDLHINELLDNTNGLSNFDMLRVQMEKFHEVMRANLKYRGQKIVFIHGKGEGVLRAEIEKEMNKSYKYCKFQDASFQQYGFGATMVTINVASKNYTI